ncbi:unnamed protein product [Caenorhabditis auriculariae]|uniref:Uncharacterized protein n=1 Tax=Caenorhabditis auriculariae TaxID=2777116 RepID=A0A8S1H5W8_9PELO|nr:unnamed protein product [Caenorhabditis auriculariae]
MNTKKVCRWAPGVVEKKSKKRRLNLHLSADRSIGANSLSGRSRRHSKAFWLEKKEEQGFSENQQWESETFYHRAIMNKFIGNGFGPEAEQQEQEIERNSPGEFSIKQELEDSFDNEKGLVEVEHEEQNNEAELWDLMSPDSSFSGSPPKNERLKRKLEEIGERNSEKVSYAKVSRLIEAEKNGKSL